MPTKLIRPRNFTIRLKTDGKGDFVRRQTKIGIEDVCLCKPDVDFSFGCQSQCYEKSAPEVVANKGHYTSNDTLVYYREEGVIDGRCDGCYAAKQRKKGQSNWGQTVSGKVTERTRKDFEELQPKTIRIARSVECCYLPLYSEALMSFLDLCIEFKAKPIIFTKALTFGREGLKGIPLPPELIQHVPSGETLTKKLIDSQSVVHFSIYYDRLEAGWGSQGFTNTFRLKEAEKFYKQGLNTTLTLVCDPTQSIEENILQGSSIGKAIRLHEELGIPLRHQSPQLNSREFALKITGKKWGFLLEKGIFRRSSPSKLYPLFLHPDFERLVQDGMGICGEIGEFQYCDKCNLQKDIRIKFPLKEKLKVKYK